MYFGHIGSTGTTFVDTYGVLYKVLNNKTIRFTITNTTFNKNYIVKYDKDKKILGYQQFNSNSGTITFTDDVKYYSFRIGYGSAVAGTTYKTKIQLEQGSTATDYEQHQGKELPLDLPVENLFDGIFAQGGLDLGNTGGEAPNNARIRSDFIPVEPNTTYTVSNHNSNIYQFGMGLYKSDKTYDSDHKINNGSWNNFPYIFTTQNDTYYVKIAFKNANNTTLSPTGDYKIMLSKGLLANAYTPYGTTPIELCKIGDYQDYFYKSGSKWYLHKEIGKVVLDGSESWTKSRTTEEVDKFFTKTSYETKSELYDVENKCSHFTYKKNTSTIGRWTLGQSNNLLSLFFCFSSYGTTTVEQFEEWLSNNKPICYIALPTATNTEITDTTLISQLEAIYNAPLYEQTNITQTNNDLPMVLDITACKDNINGIKAFIRK